MRAVGRILWLPFAFLLAAAATLFVIVSLGQERIVQAMTGRGPTRSRPMAGFDLLARLVVRVRADPAAGAAAGHRRRGRAHPRRLYYVIGGGAALAVVPLLSRISQPPTVLDLSPVVWQVLATAGFAGDLSTGCWPAATPDRAQRPKKTIEILSARGKLSASVKPGRRWSCGIRVLFGLPWRASRPAYARPVRLHAGRAGERALECTDRLPKPVSARWRPPPRGLFAALPALIGAAIGEWRGIRAGPTTCWPASPSPSSAS